MNETITTEFGTANLNNHGYYRITSKKEGNFCKFLHRLIFEKFYGTPIPQGYIIHHKDGNKLNNCILNLQLMRISDHLKLHNASENNPMYDKNHSLKSSIQMSKNQNNTGIFRVRQKKVKDCKQGFLWEYRYYENKKEKSIASVSLENLKEKVLSKGLDWIEFNCGDDDL